MNLKKILSERNMTVYGLSKKSGIPKTTIYDIYSGKSTIGSCNCNTVYQLAKALDCTMEDLMKDEKEEYDYTIGKPMDKSYLEMDLPKYLNLSLKAMIKSWNKLDNGIDDYEWDMNWCDLNASINTAEHGFEITSEQAWYLREKYLRMERV